MHVSVSVCVCRVCVCIFLYFLLLFAVLFLLLLRGFKTFVVVAVDFFSPCCCYCIALMAYKKEEAKHSRVSTREGAGAGASSGGDGRLRQLGLVGSEVGSILAVSIGFALSAFLIPFIFLKKKTGYPTAPFPSVYVCVCVIYTCTLCTGSPSKKFVHCLFIYLA